MKNIAIYGTGKWGKAAFNLFLKIGCKISFFCRTQAEDNETFCNLKVLKVEDIIKKNTKDLIIMIAIRDQKIVAEIKGKLLDAKFRESQILDIRHFLLDNMDIVFNSLDSKNEEEYFCLCCNNNVNKFLADGERNSRLFEQHRVIGAGYRDNNVCPLCGATDRIRWQKYVFNNFINILKEKCCILHIAPEDFIYPLIKRNVQCDYYTGDIELGKAQNKIDLTMIQFQDSFFDYIIANHVLEHIKEIDKVFNEIKRVLKPSGKLIISFPVCKDIKTIEEICTLSEEERLMQFGQSDHVRLFGYDFKQYIEKYGFNIKIVSPEDMLDAKSIEKYGFIKDDLLLICSKKKIVIT